MEPGFLQRIQGNLLAKRQNLLQWLQQAPVSKKAMVLGETPEMQVQAHLNTLEDALGKIEDQTLGICQICHEHVGSNYLEMDYTARVCLDHLSDLDRRELEAELEFTQMMQRALLPQQPAVIPGMELAAFSRPAQIVGGDYFDFFRYRDGAHGLAIADAMGHGISAGLLIHSFQAALRMLAPESTSPASLLERANRLFLHNANFTTFVTAIICRFDPQQRSLFYSNAGHNPAALVRAEDGNVTWLLPTGAAIGLVEDYSIRTEGLTMNSEDVLVFYTDGVSEAINSENQNFGEGRLARLTQQYRSQTAAEILHTLRDALVSFCSGQALDDDVTLLVAKILAT